MITLEPGQIGEVVLLGAHCDDIAIGAGGTLLTLAQANPGLRVHALVLSGAGTPRAEEEWRALEAFTSGASLTLEVLDLPDGRVPAHWDSAKDSLAALARRTDPQLVLAPQRSDAHQDHRTLAELTPTEFRDHLVLGYEIPKWESDLPAATHYVPVETALAEVKVGLLFEHYPSQAGHDWFDREVFLGLSRLRGMQCHAQHAEAFVVDKAVIGFGKNPA